MRRRGLAGLCSSPRLPLRQLPVAHACRCYAASRTPLLDSVAVEAARERVAARKPLPDEHEPSRTLYRPAVPMSIFDRASGRWRGHPIDLNHTLDMWSRRETGAVISQNIPLKVWRTCRKIPPVSHLNPATFSLKQEKFRRMLTIWRSETFRRVLYPDLAACVGVSCAVPTLGNQSYTMHLTQRQILQLPCIWVYL